MDIIAYDKVQLDKSVVALGKFQGLHNGHMMLINEVVAIARKEQLTGVVFTINIHNDKMVNLPDERFAILEEMGVDVDVECEFSSEFAMMQPEQFVKSILVDKLNASYVVVGSDFRFGYKRQGDVSLLKTYGDKYGFEVIAFDKLCVDGNIVSSSLIRELIEAGNVDSVEKYMGRPYSVSGEVCTGKQLGRTIGFPTINIIPKEDKLLPPYGVYETFINLDGTIYKGVTNVGNNPTVENTDRTFVETNIIDFDDNLYGETVTVCFKRYIRKEKKFNSIEELKNQIKRDKICVMHQ